MGTAGVNTQAGTPVQISVYNSHTFLSVTPCILSNYLQLVYGALFPLMACKAQILCKTREI
jgi:hypothetical protein